MIHMKRQRVLIAMLIASVAINVVLAHQVRQFNRLLHVRTEPGLKSGASVQPFEAVDLAGRTETVSYTRVSKATVLYIFTPPCVWCARNTDNFKTLVDKKGAEYRIIGLSLSKNGLQEYAASQGLSIPIYTGLSPETIRAYKLGGTPQTIVISPEGRVLQNWIGAYVGHQKSEVEAFFSVTLPGLREVPGTQAGNEVKEKRAAVN
jgi:peroxiredoxin